jgi:putative endonuclease
MEMHESQTNRRKSSNTTIGREGETRAVNFLVGKGIRILERNYRTRSGEIDIIAQEGETIVFIEVKSWSYYGIESLEKALNTKKRHKIIETSKYFLSLHREYRYMAIRFDIIFISQKGITHLASAFIESV